MSSVNVHETVAGYVVGLQVSIGLTYIFHSS